MDPAFRQIQEAFSLLDRAAAAHQVVLARQFAPQLKGLKGRHQRQPVGKVGVGQGHA